VEAGNVQPEQRVDKGEEAFAPVERWWAPYTVHGAEGEQRGAVDVRPGDLYASVDDVADGTVVFEVSEWPRLDREGRLHWGFEDEPFELVAGQQDAQQIVDANRHQHDMTGPDRPIRVGDVFLLRGLRDEEPLDQAELVLDVSAAAREAAKAALYGAAGSTLSEHAAMEMMVMAEYEEAEPETGHFDVRQRKLGGREDAETGA
jgi:hypothetical protein